MTTPLAAALYGAEIAGDVAYVEVRGLLANGPYVLRTPSGATTDAVTAADGRALFSDVPFYDEGEWNLVDSVTGLALSSFTVSSGALPQPTVRTNVVSGVPTAQVQIGRITVSSSGSMSCYWSDSEKADVTIAGSVVEVRIHYAFDTTVAGFMRVETDGHVNVASTKSGTFRAGERGYVTALAFWTPGEWRAGYTADLRPGGYCPWIGVTVDAV